MIEQFLKVMERSRAADSALARCAEDMVHAREVVLNESECFGDSNFFSEGSDRRVEQEVICERSGKLFLLSRANLMLLQQIAWRKARFIH